MFGGSEVFFSELEDLGAAIVGGHDAFYEVVNDADDAVAVVTYFDLREDKAMKVANCDWSSHWVMLLPGCNAER